MEADSSGADQNFAAPACMTPTSSSTPLRAVLISRAKHQQASLAGGRPRARALFPIPIVSQHDIDNTG
jgi:hypothetical protein